MVNWKTTLTGVAAGASLIATAASAIASQGTITWQSILLSLAGLLTGALGVSAKDATTPSVTTIITPTSSTTLTSHK